MKFYDERCADDRHRDGATIEMAEAAGKRISFCSVSAPKRSPIAVAGTTRSGTMRTSRRRVGRWT